MLPSQALERAPSASPRGGAIPCRALTAPDSSRVMSSRSAPGGSAGRPRPDGLEQLAPSGRIQPVARPREGCSTRPVMAASGVRRSCETELSSELRSFSVSMRTWAACASSARRPRSSAMAVWLDESSPIGEAAQGSRAHGARAAGSPRRRGVPARPPVAGRGPCAPGRVAVPRPAELAVVEHPAATRQLVASTRSPRERLRGQQHAGGIREKDEHPTAKDLGDVPGGQPPGCWSRRAMPAKLPAQGVQGSRPPLALAGGLGQPADPDGETADDQGDDEHHCERHEVLRVATAKVR